MEAGERHDQLLFSYGTLQLEPVQLALFGRRLDGTPDAVTGFAFEAVTIDDPAIIGQSGAETHPILVAGDAADAAVPGVLLRLSAAELAAADDYECAPYVRIAARLCSGTVAWVYVRGDGGG